MENPKMKNLNLLFNKTYYDGFKNFAGQNDNLINAIFDKDNDFKKSEVAQQKFCMRTLYPGLLVGIGYPHGVAKAIVIDPNDKNNDIPVGFSFDYVSGQPYIPGSSVKGLLRSGFQHYDLIQELVGDQTLDVKALEALEKEIFDGEDIFFDAVVRRGNESGNLLGFDYITPHPDPVKNPIPIRMLKVLPDVVFEFRFSLKDGDKVKADQKCALFKELLELLGIGAKTNVGYGTLKCIKETDLEKYLPSAKQPEPQKQSDQKKFSQNKNNYSSDHRNKKYH